MAIDIFQVGAQLGAPASKVSNVRYDNSGQQAVARESSQTGRIIQAGVEQVREQIIRTDVLQANNEYVKRTNDLRMQLMQKKEKGALDIVGEYEAGERKIRSELMAQSPQSVKYGKGAMLFDYSTQQTDNANRRVLGQYRAQQFEAWQNTTYENNQNQITTTLMQNPNDPQALKDAVNKTIFSVEDIFGTYGEERVELETNKALGRLGTAVIKQAIVNQDYTESKRLVRYFNDVLTPDQRNSFNYIINQKEQLENSYKIAQQLYQQYGNDSDAAMSALESMKNGTSSFDSFVNAISGQESGGNYDAVNARTGASGKYQIMPENWPAWSKEAGLQDNAKMTPENQEKVARFKLKQYWDKYGPRGAAIAWYAGEGALSYSEEALNRKQGNGDEPSINEYVDSILGRMGTESPKMSFEEGQTVSKIYKNIIKDQEERQKKYNDLLYRKIVGDIYGMQQQGVSYEAAIDWIKSTAGLDIETGKKMISAADYFYGANGKKGSNKASSTTVKRVNDMLGDGAFATREEYLEFAKEQGLNADQIYEANKTYDKYKEGKGEFAYDWNNDIKYQIVGDIEENPAKEAAWIGAKALLQEWIISEEQKTGVTPPLYQVIEKGKEFITKQPVGYMETRGTFLNRNETVELSLADYKRSGIESVTKINKIGNALYEDLYSVRLSNGTTEIMNAARLYTITR